MNILRLLIISVLLVNLTHAIPFISLDNTTPHNYLTAISATLPRQNVTLLSMPAGTKLTNLKQDETTIYLQVVVQLPAQTKVEIEPFLVNKETSNFVRASIGELFFVSHMQKTTKHVATIKPYAIYFTLKTDPSYGIEITQEAPAWYTLAQSYVVEQYSKAQDKVEQAYQNLQDKIEPKMEKLKNQLHSLQEQFAQITWPKK